jgi:tetratricopeptide (TPR) repeat protein
VLDLYAPCPCGSGKKFKWCCQPIHVDIDKAFRQDAEGQHETALRTMEKVTADHPDNPEAWGRKAELLYNLDKPEEAEAALEKALAINPNYPFGHYLKGSFRLHEGEIAGALLLYRKAADLYDPEARSILSQLHTLIFDCEMKLNHPLAARAAATLALRFNPATEGLRDGIDAVFGPANPNLPKSAKQEYKFQPVDATPPPPPSEGGATAGSPASEGGATDTSPPSEGGARGGAWEKALASAGTGKLTDAARAFGQLTQSDPNDVAAWYNLGLCQAWLGNNAAGLEAFDRYVALEPDEDRAAVAWTLGEILRCGQGMVEQADHLQYSLDLGLGEPRVFAQAIQKLQQQGVLAGLQVSEDRTVLQGLVLLPAPQALTPELQAKQSPRLGAFFVLMGNFLHLWNIQDEILDKALEMLRPHLGQQVSQIARARGPVQYHDIFSEALIFPPASITEKEFEQRLGESFAKYLEETWLHRPLKSLGQVPPIDAAGHPVLRKKLRGVVQFLEEVAALTKFPYDFARLRRKLNLADGPATTAGAHAGPDIGAMGAPELAGLEIEGLSEPELEEAFQTAMKVDARELAGKFAQALVARPSRPERPDRYPLFNHLIGQSLTQGNTTAALDQLNEGEKDDCEHNAGRRRNDYELRRAQIQVKAGQVADAGDGFERLIARVPSELKYRGNAAEAMLSAKEPRRALVFAEQGLAEARKQNNRDSEQYFLELAAAARKQGA